MARAALKCRVTPNEEGVENIVRKPSMHTHDNGLCDSIGVG